MGTPESYTDNVIVLVIRVLVAASDQADCRRKHYEHREQSYQTFLDFHCLFLE